MSGKYVTSLDYIQLKYIGCYIFMDSAIPYTPVKKMKMKGNADDSLTFIV